MSALPEHHMQMLLGVLEKDFVPNLPPLLDQTKPVMSSNVRIYPVHLVRLLFINLMLPPMQSRALSMTSTTTASMQSIIMH
jgi:hypothetical protein